MVRLVFRPYTQLRRSICTSESLRTSTRVSPGFVLARHRSPSFGSQRVRSGFVRPAKSRGIERPGDAPALFETGSPLAAPSSGPSFAFTTPREFSLDSTTCAHVRLLGPCFKTGRVGPDFYSPLWAGLFTPRRQVTVGQDRPQTPRTTIEPKLDERLTNAPHDDSPNRSRSPTRRPTSGPLRG